MIGNVPDGTDARSYPACTDDGPCNLHQHEKGYVSRDLAHYLDVQFTAVCKGIRSCSQCWFWTFRTNKRTSHLAAR